MKTKTGRFNYLPTTQESPEGRHTPDRVEYKEIISKLTREHESRNTQEIFALNSPQKRGYSPIGQIQMKTRQGSNHIKSIILNEQITSNKKQEQKQRKDAYRIIKESHIPKGQDFDDFYEKSKTPPKVYYSPFKEHQPVNQHQQSPVVKFYQIKPPLPANDLKRVNPAKNNQPYVNLMAKAYEQPDQDQAAYNPEARAVTPTKMSDLASSRTINNKVYKTGKSQERIYPQQKPSNHNFYQASLPSKAHYQPSSSKQKNIWKRSCYDYVPEQMRSRLRRQQ